MSKVKNNKKEKNDEVNIFNNLKLIKIFCLIVAIIFLVLFSLCFAVREFIPATLIALSLELFSVSYYFYESSTDRKVVYSIFIVGVIVLAISVIYTLVSII